MSLTPILAFGAWAAAVSTYDMRVRRVPNWLVVIGILGACAQYLGGLRVLSLTIEQSLLGGLIGFVVFLPLYVFRFMGAADVKVFAVLGLWLGAGALLPVWMMASLAACVHAVYSIAHRRPQAISYASVESGHAAAVGNAVAGGIAASARPVGKRALRGAPYAAYLVIAACCVVLYRLYPGSLS